MIPLTFFDQISWRHDAPINRIARSLYSNAIAVALKDGTVHVYSPSDVYRDADSSVVLRGHSASVNDVCFALKGAVVATASSDKSARIFHAQTGKEITSFRSREKLYCVTTRLHDNVIKELIFGGSECGVEVAGQDEFEFFPLSDAPVSAMDTVVAIQCSPNGDIWACNVRFDILLVNASDKSEIRRLHGHRMWITRIMFSPDGSLLASSSDDNTVRLWSVPEGKQWAVFHHNTDVEDIDFSPDGKLLVSVTYDGSVHVWSVGRKTKCAFLTIPLDCDPSCVCFAASGVGIYVALKVYQHSGAISHEIYGINFWEPAEKILRAIVIPLMQSSVLSPHTILSVVDQVLLQRYRYSWPACRAKKMEWILALQEAWSK